MSRICAAAALAALLVGAQGGWQPGWAAGDDVTPEQLLKADSDPGNWLTHHRDYSAQRFSPLAQINRGNVKNLHVAWTLQLGGIEGGGIWSHGGLEGTPIVQDGIMYATDGWGSVYKIDTHGGEGKLIWKMDPKTDHDWAGAVACCGVDNRGVALIGNLVLSHSLDGRLIATNKETGEIVWQRQVADPDKGEVITAAPLVVRNLVYTGVSGAEYGIRGWIAATDLTTHKEVWRTYTIPAKGEPGSETWKDDHNAAATGGGSTWVTGSYDPATNTLYWGVGNPGPDWDSEFRPGDNLYTDSTLALDADSGKIKWHYQHTPNDAYDYDSVSENVLVNAPIHGRDTHLDLEADRNGFAYALNRDNGEFVWGLPFVKQVTWTKGLNPETGKPAEYDPKAGVQKYNAAVTPTRANPVTEICPGNMGGKNWPPTAYNPLEKLWYIPVIESCNRITVKAEDPTKPVNHRDTFTGGGPTEDVRITGSVTAIDVTTGKEAGKHETPFPMLGGLLATPDLVFYGQPDGKVAALDAKTLQELWSFNTGGGVSAPPMTFTSDGKQYVAVLVGQGGAWDKWFIEATPELKKIQPSSTLYVFALN
ncbi:MAG TPA: PQQ-dependent dehydrogenase, methanol/ethanol family [Rhodopila sp.]|nr:PQQ-dependent dehydrogenase, methanol/ethanol family [Rhodopila sp.]